MLEIEPFGQRGRAVPPPEVAETATKPSPSLLLQKHSLGDCIIDTLPLKCRGSGAYRFAARYLIVIVISIVECRCCDRHRHRHLLDVSDTRTLTTDCWTPPAGRVNESTHARSA